MKTTVKLPHKCKGTDQMDLENKIVVAVIMHDETRIWSTHAAKGSDPAKIHIEVAQRHLHVREAQHHGGHGTSQYDVPYFESITEALKPAAEILIIGHGKGKANSAMQLISHCETHAPDVARKIVGLIDENLPALTEQQILESARDWFSQRFGQPVHYWEASAH